MDLGIRDCQKPECNGKVQLHADTLEVMIEQVGYGQCDKCGQKYEVELFIEASDPIPLDDD